MEEEKEEVSTATTPTDEEVWSSCYLIVDFPGQVELYTHATSASSLLGLLSKPADKGGYGASLVNVNLVDATSIYDAGRFISSCITSLMSTIRLEVRACEERRAMNEATSVLSDDRLLLCDSLPRLNRFARR